jgi:hypothetical protein
MIGQGIQKLFVKQFSVQKKLITKKKKFSQIKIAKIENDFQSGLN